MEEKTEIKDISYETYEKQSEEYYKKAFRDFLIIVAIVSLVFLIG